jgi:sulfane dehydrogenase subunit SoxC
MNSKLSARRKFLKDSAALAGLAAGVIPAAAAQMSMPHSQAHSAAPATDAASKGAATKDAAAKDIACVPDEKDLIAYGERSPFVKSIRIPVAERMSPDDFGMTFHVTSPLQDSVGMITASSLHYVSTHRGSYLPDIDPAEYKLMIHGMVDRPLILTVAEIKRFPSVTRPHFLECSGNRARASHKTVQQTHGLTSCSEWTGVPLSLLLKEVGVQDGAAFFIAEGSETVKGAVSLPIAKAMDDCLICYGQNGEPVRPHQGYPIRLIVPGFEGMVNVKWLRRIKLVEKNYMTYNDYGHLAADSTIAALNRQIGPKSVITYPSGEQKLPGPGFYDITGLAWSGSGAIRTVDVSVDGGQSWKAAELRTPALPMAHTRFGFPWKWDGKETVIMSRCTDEIGTVQPTRAEIAKYWNVPNDANLQIKGLDNSVFPWKVASDGTVHNGLA